MPKLKPKVKLILDPRLDEREISGNMSDWISRDGHDSRTGEFVTPDVLVGEYMSETFADAMEGADWSDDPGTGRAVLLPDGREVLNPIPVAPPASIAAAAAEPSVNDLVTRALARHFEQLKDADEIDSLDDVDDFPEDEDWTPFSQFEIVLRDEAPAIPREPVSAEALADVAEAEAALPPAPAKPGRKPKAPEVLDEEGAQ